MKPETSQPARRFIRPKGLRRISIPLIVGGAVGLAGMSWVMWKGHDATVLSWFER